MPPCRFEGLMVNAWDHPYWYFAFLTHLSDLWELVNSSSYHIFNFLENEQVRLVALKWQPTHLVGPLQIIKWKYFHLIIIKGPPSHVIRLWSVKNKILSPFQNPLTFLTLSLPLSLCHSHWNPPFHSSHSREMFLVKPTWMHAKNWRIVGWKDFIVNMILVKNCPY